MEDAKSKMSVILQPTFVDVGLNDRSVDSGIWRQCRILFLQR